MDDVEIAILNCEEAIHEASFGARGFAPNSRSVIVFANDLRVLIEAARKGKSG